MINGIEMGARCLLRGNIHEGRGTFYPPTVLNDVTKKMPVCDEESFGPVAATISVTDEAEAMRVANDSDFGLGQRCSSGASLGRTDSSAGTKGSAVLCQCPG